MSKTLIDSAIVNAAMGSMEITDLNNASIRQMSGIVAGIKKESGTEFIHCEIGVPGLAPASIGVKAEHEALDSGIPAKYPPMEGIAELKREASRFMKAFLDIEVGAANCVPTVGSMQGAFAAFTLMAQMNPEKDTILFIDPGFSVQKTQTAIIGMKSVAFDIYNYRADKLRAKLESYLKEGNISAIVYSNPNNPSWMCLCESELKTIGELATEYDAIAIEDLAYLAMDFRTDMGIPFEAPYQPTVAKYTDNYLILMSGSKIFSYAGQRIAMIIPSNKLFDREYFALRERYGIARFSHVLVQVILYGLTAGTSHTAQYALAAMLKAANDGKFNFVEETKEYGRRTKRMKEIFLKHGFNIIYDKDLDQPLSDGFFFTVGYKGVEGGELLRRLLHFGISAIVLSTTGSRQQGLRICSSAIKEHHYAMLDERLAAFGEEYGK